MDANELISQDHGTSGIHDSINIKDEDLPENSSNPLKVPEEITPDEGAKKTPDTPGKLTRND